MTLIWELSRKIRATTRLRKIIRGSVGCGVHFVKTSEWADGNVTAGTVGGPHVFRKRLMLTKDLETGQ